MVRAVMQTSTCCADQGVRHRIEEALDLDVIVETDAGQAPFGVDVFGGGQRRSAGRSIASNNWRRLMPSRRIGRSFICVSASRIAALHSASEKKVRWRSRPRM